MTDPLRPGRILLVDDHAIIRDGLALLLQNISPQPELLLADSLSRAIAILEDDADIDLLLLDLNLGDAVGLSGLGALIASFPAQPIAVLTGDTDPTLLAAAARTPVLGILPKSLSSARTLEAIEGLLAGQPYFPESLRESRFKRPAALSHLSPRQVQIFSLCARGHTNREIAAQLDLSENTIKTHLRQIFERLDLRNRADAAAMAARMGLGYGQSKEK